MAIDFPSAPSPGDEYTFAGRVWVWLGNAWASLGAQVTALSVLGRSTNSNGAAESITASSDETVLRRSGSTLGFGKIVEGHLDFDVVTKTASTGAANMPSGTTAERPGSPVTGQTRWNTDLDRMEIYDGTAWGGIGSNDLFNYMNLH